MNNPDIHIILVHEQDSLKGGCEFAEFFKVTPKRLIEEPYSLYKDIAIPLYSMEAYRDVSIKMIVSKMVGYDPRLGTSDGG